jgi:hypothetical protein
MYPYGRDLPEQESDRRAQARVAVNIRTVYSDPILILPFLNAHKRIEARRKAAGWKRTPQDGQSGPEPS